MPERAEKNSDLKLPPEILDLLKGNDEIELEDVEMIVDELEFIYQPGTMPILPKMIGKPKYKPKSIIEVPFNPPIQKYPGEIVEVVLGATKSQGGSRVTSVTIGGDKSPAFYTFENSTPNPPIISLDVLNTEMESIISQSINLILKWIVTTTKDINVTTSTCNDLVPLSMTFMLSLC